MTNNNRPSNRTQYDYFKQIFEGKKVITKEDLLKLKKKETRMGFPKTDVALLMKDGESIEVAELLKYIKIREEKRHHLFKSFSHGHEKLNLYKITKNLDKMDVDHTDTEILVTRLKKQSEENGEHKVTYQQFCTFLADLPLHKIEDIQNNWDTAVIYPDMFPPQKRDDLIDDSRLYNPLVLLTSGAIAGAVSRSITAPLDRLKVLFQAGGSVGGEKIVSIYQTVNAMWRDGGLLGFYRGNGTNIVKIAPETAIKFWVYENFKKIISGKDQDVKNLTVLKRFIAGAVAGVSAQAAIYPLEVAKTRLALAETGEYRGIADCLRRAVSHGGVKELYRGLVPALTGIIPYAGVDLAVYSLLKDKYVQKYREHPSSISLFGFGVVSSVSGQVVAYPMTVVRTRLQAQEVLLTLLGMINRPVQYTGMVDCCSTIYKTEGVKAFYRGMLPNFMKAVPAISISYVVYEKTRDFIVNRVDF